MTTIPLPRDAHNVPLTDEEHQRLDQEILSICGMLLSLLDPALAPYVLYFIVQGAPHPSNPLVNIVG